MNESSDAVENLKKIGLTVQAGSKRDDMDIVSDPMVFELIFGIGTQGLTPFEFELADKRVGDVIILHLNRSQIQDSFQHIQLPPPALSGGCSELYFNFRIMSISSAENREIVSAMAAVANCGNGCCGNH